MNVGESKLEQNLERLSKCKLYGIVDAGYLNEDEMEGATRDLINGGVGIIQLRAKKWTEQQIEFVAKRLVKICQAEGVIFVVNDFPNIAANIGADGIHIGQDDGQIEDVRDVVGSSMIIGRSTHSIEQAVKAADQGFDYIGFGPLFPTPTKKGRPSIGLESVLEVVGNLKIPVFCIGGIKRSNIETVVTSGANRAVVVSDILLAEDKEQATREVVMSLDK